MAGPHAIGGGAASTAARPALGGGWQDTGRTVGGVAGYRGRANERKRKLELGWVVRRGLSSVQYRRGCGYHPAKKGEEASKSGVVEWGLCAVRVRAPIAGLGAGGEGHGAREGRVR